MGPPLTPRKFEGGTGGMLETKGRKVGGGGSSTSGTYSVNGGGPAARRARPAAGAAARAPSATNIINARASKREGIRVDVAGNWPPALARGTYHPPAGNAR